MSKKRIVWIVNKYEGHLTVRGMKLRDQPLSLCSFSFMGVFATEPEAVAACRDENYLVGPAVMGKQLPDRLVPWVGCYYPIKAKVVGKKSKRSKRK